MLQSCQSLRGSRQPWRARAAAALAFVVAAAGAENRTTLRELPVGTRGRWEYRDGAFVFYCKRDLVLRIKAPTVKQVRRSHDHHGTFDASCLVRADPRTVLEGMRGGWGVLETGKPSAECEFKSKTQVCRDRAAEKRRTGEWVPLAIMTVATSEAARRRLLDKARRSWRLWQAIGRRRDKRTPPAPTSPAARRPPQEPPPAPEPADPGLPWVQRPPGRPVSTSVSPHHRSPRSQDNVLRWVHRATGQGRTLISTQLGRVAGYLRREAMLFKGMDRAIAAAAPGATPRARAGHRREPRPLRDLRGAARRARRGGRGAGDARAASSRSRPRWRTASMAWRCSTPLDRVGRPRRRREMT